MGMPASLGVLSATEVADWRERSSIVSVNEVVNIPHKLCRGHVGCCFAHHAAWWWDSRWVSMFEDYLNRREAVRKELVRWYGWYAQNANVTSAL